MVLSQKFANLLAKQISTPALRLSLNREEDRVTAETEDGATAGNENGRSTKNENKIIEEDLKGPNR